MKKLFSVLLAVFFVLFFVSVNAQVKLGLQAGINLADVNADPLPPGYETGMRTALIAGGILNYSFSPLLSLQLEPAYIQKGASIDVSITENGADIKAEGTFSADYIDIPVLIKAAFGSQQVKPFIVAGASAAFLLGDVKLKQDKITVNGQDVTAMVPDNEKEETVESKSTDFILNFGGGVAIPLGQVEIFIEGQYNLGLTNVSDDSNDNTEIKTRGIQIKAGVLFSL